MENLQQNCVATWLLHCMTSQPRQTPKVLEERNFLGKCWVSLDFSLIVTLQNQESLFFKKFKGVFFQWVFLCLQEERTKEIKIGYPVSKSLEFAFLTT